MSKKPWQPSARDIAALASVHIQQTYNFAQHYTCAPQFFETLKALQMQADLMHHAAERANLPFHPLLEDLVKTLDTYESKGPKLSIETQACHYGRWIEKLR